jgi:hypothetical protein
MQAVQNTNLGERRGKQPESAKNKASAQKMQRL